MVAISAGDARGPRLTSRGTLDRDGRETVGVAFAVVLDEHALAGADKAVEPAGTAVCRSLA
jgi:hypothetical protein